MKCDLEKNVLWMKTIDFQYTLDATWLQPYQCDPKSSLNLRSVLHAH